MRKVRDAAVAGLFYPGSSEALKSDIDLYLRRGRAHSAAKLKDTNCNEARCFVVPHAGYQYSGEIAGSVYAAIQDQVFSGKEYKRAVLIGPAHRVYCQGLCYPSSDFFSTPLGEIHIDQELLESVQTLPFVNENEGAHLPEHCLEVQIPFLQHLLPDIQLLPLLSGQANPDMIQNILERVWQFDDTLILISTDLSHYLQYSNAVSHDQATINNILQGHGENIHQEDACGATPLKGLLKFTEQHKLIPSLLYSANSGDTSGDKGKVVGYAALAFSPSSETARLIEDKIGQVDTSLAGCGDTLAEIAIHTLESALLPDQAGDAPEISKELKEKLSLERATFVTLHKHGKLRGCIGSVEPRRSLEEDVRENVLSAAFHDPRFSPVRTEELKHLSLEISILTPMEPISFSNAKELFSQITPGVHGVMIETGFSRALFLPQVWKQIPGHTAFFRELKRKARIVDNLPLTSLKVFLFQVESYSISNISKA